jgi:hypothetical protein
MSCELFSAWRDDFSGRLILILTADYAFLARDHRMGAPLWVGGLDFWNSLKK